MSRPFVSHDGVDAQGVRAEVFVQTGTGTVKDLSENGNNVRVNMTVEGLKHPVGGWTSKSEPIYPLLVEAKDQGREITYRIESQRKPGIDRSTPIAELRKTQEIANENTRSLFVGIDTTYSSEMVTNPAEDPNTGGRIPATDPRHQPAPASKGPGATGGGFSAEQALAGLAAARKGALPATVVDAAAALALAAGATVEQVLAAGVDQQTEPQPRPVQRVFAKEAAPFMVLNTDGRPNLGSYAVQAAAGAESLAADLIAQSEQQNADEHNARIAAGEIEGEPVTPTKVNFKKAAALGSVLLGLADQVQVAAIGGGRPDRMATSHTRARSFVYDAVKNRYPVPFSGSKEQQAEWGAQVVEEAVARFTRVVAMVNDVPPTQAPTAPVAQGAQTAQAPEAPAAEAPAPAEQAAPVAQDEETGAQVHQMTAPQTAQQAPRRVPIEGEDGFTAPAQEVLQRFGALALAAGFEPTPDSPVSTYLSHKFGVTAARKINGADLDRLVSWFEERGQEGAAKFHRAVLDEVRVSA